MSHKGQEKHIHAFVSSRVDDCNGRLIGLQIRPKVDEDKNGFKTGPAVIDITPQSVQLPHLQSHGITNS